MVQATASFPLNQFLKPSDDDGFDSDPVITPWMIRGYVARGHGGFERSFSAMAPVASSFSGRPLRITCVWFTPCTGLIQKGVERNTLLMKRLVEKLAGTWYANLDAVSRRDGARDIQ